MASHTLWWTFIVWRLHWRHYFCFSQSHHYFFGMWILNYFVIQSKVMMNLLLIIIFLLLILLKRCCWNCRMFKSSTGWKPLWKLHHMRRFQGEEFDTTQALLFRAQRVEARQCRPLFSERWVLHWSNCSFNFQFRFFHFFYMLKFIIQLASHFKVISYFVIPASFIVNWSWFSSHDLLPIHPTLFPFPSQSHSSPYHGINLNDGTSRRIVILIICYSCKQSGHISLPLPVSS